MIHDLGILASMTEVSDKAEVQATSLGMGENG